MNLNCAFELPLLTEQIPQNEIDLGRLGIGPRCLGELGNGSVDLTGGEQFEPENVVDR